MYNLNLCRLKCNSRLFCVTKHHRPLRFWSETGRRGRSLVGDAGVDRSNEETDCCGAWPSIHSSAHCHPSSPIYTAERRFNWWRPVVAPSVDSNRITGCASPWIIRHRWTTRMWWRSLSRQARKRSHPVQRRSDGEKERNIEKKRLYCESIFSI